MILGSLVFLFYLSKFSPFKERLDQFLNLFSTIVLIVLYCFCLGFAVLPASSRSTREVLGYIFIALVIVLFLVNIVLIIVTKIIQFVRVKCRRRKEKKHKKKL